MCNIAGYTGTRQAAPILIEMIRKQEGFAGGYFTGLATICDGKIHYAKIMGDLDRLLELTDAGKLPGTTGIIHSRSDSGGGDEWAHPFIATENGEPALAYVANGAPGYFKTRTAEYNKKIEKMLADGCEMPSRVKVDSDIYNTLSDDTTVHMSDVMCQLIMRGIREGKTVSEAMGTAFCEMPAQILGLTVSQNEPDRISFSRIDKPMSVGFASHGAYMATSAIAFPEDAGEPQLLPVCSSGSVNKDSFTAVKYKELPARVAQLDSRVRTESYQIICDLLGRNPKSIKEICSEFKPCFEKSDCVPDDQALYEALYSLYREGKLQIKSRRVPGAIEGIDAPEFVLSVK